MRCDCGPNGAEAIVPKLLDSIPTTGCAIRMRCVVAMRNRSAERRLERLRAMKPWGVLARWGGCVPTVLCGLAALSSRPRPASKGPSVAQARIKLTLWRCRPRKSSTTPLPGLGIPSSDVLAPSTRAVLRKCRWGLSDARVPNCCWGRPRSVRLFRYR